MFNIPNYFLRSVAQKLECFAEKRREWGKNFGFGGVRVREFEGSKVREFEGGGGDALI